MEEKFIDNIIDILDLMSQYSPTTPPNPNLPLIIQKIQILKAQRLKSTDLFSKHLESLSDIVKNLSDIKV